MQIKRSCHQICFIPLADFYLSLLLYSVKGYVRSLWDEGAGNMQVTLGCS